MIMTLNSLLPVTQKEGGFYITDLADKSEMFFEDSDDFYERPFAKYMYDRVVIFIATKNNMLNIILK